MNNIRWITGLFNSGRRTQQYFGNRRNNRGGMLLSLLGLGIGATVYSIVRGRDNGRMQPMLQPIQNFFRNNQNAIGRPNQTASGLANLEFSDEITTDPAKRKTTM